MSRNAKNGTLTWEATYCPSFKGLSCYILPGAGYMQAVVMMASVGFERSDKIEDADLVVFLGGSDVNPEMYGHKNVACYSPDNERDAYEKTVYDMCCRRAIPMFGICRGAQFLHVMNGGKLWQDVHGHAGSDHYIVDLDTDTRVLATSTHHQMIRDNERIRIVAVSEDQISKEFKAADVFKTLSSPDSHEIEIEAAIYDDTHTFMVQGHPEFGSEYYKSWTMHRLGDFLFNDVGIQVAASKDAKAKETLILEDADMVRMIEEQIG